MQEEKGHATPQGTSQERKRPKGVSSHFLAMSYFIDSKPSCHGEAKSEKVWQDAMT
jgi:hypothetical protein